MTWEVTRAEWLQAAQQQSLRREGRLAEALDGLDGFILQRLGAGTAPDAPAAADPAVSAADASAGSRLPARTSRVVLLALRGAGLGRVLPPLLRVGAHQRVLLDTRHVAEPPQLANATLARLHAQLKSLSSMRVPKLF